MPTGNFALLAFSDVFGFSLIASAFIGMVRNEMRTRSNAQVFWRLMAVGTFIWCVTQGSWVYFEVLTKQGVPDLFWGDFILFIHLIPMMIAAAGIPHIRRDVRKSGQQFLDQVLLALWWVFLYLIVLAPWEYVKVDPQTYSFSYNVLYMIEHVALTIGFGLLYLRANGVWKRLYGRFFIACLVYGSGSLILNIGLDLPKDIPWAYYAGGPYDMPWIAALIVWNWAVYRSGEDNYELSTTLDERLSTPRFSWSAVFSTAAALITPAGALYLVLMPTLHAEVDRFRLFTLLVALALITVLVFIKQWVLNRALVRSLSQSREAYNDLRRMQGQLLETEKLVSIGRLVAGAAHEINNPLTAIVGYSDLMATDHSVKPEHRDFAHKILQQARRTKSLVQNLLAFAKQTPPLRTAADMNALALGAVQLQLLEPRNHHIETLTELAPDLPLVWVDRGQITQVFLDIMNHATDSIVESGAIGSLTIRTWQENGNVLWSCSARDNSASAPAKADPVGFRLSASHSIILEQGGSLTVTEESGEELFVVALPTSGSASSVAADSVASHS
jgi:signal transduction histidine kinase